MTENEKPLSASVAAVEDAEGAAGGGGVRSLLKRLHVVEQDNLTLGRRVRACEIALFDAAISLLSYDASYGGGNGREESFEIAALLGYDDDLTDDAVRDWLIESRVELAGLAETPPATATGKATTEDADA